MACERIKRARKRAAVSEAEAAQTFGAIEVVQFHDVACGARRAYPSLAVVASNPAATKGRN